MGIIVASPSCTKIALMNFSVIALNLFKYKNSLILKRAVERNLEIIGEAINRIKQRDPEFLKKISEANSIIGLRNHVIHSYDNISDESIWSILTNHLPKLKSEVDALIGKL